MSLPKGWEILPLSELADKIMVGIASAATHAYRDSGIPMLRNQNIKEGKIDDSSLLFIDPEYEKTHKNKRLKAGDVITVRTGYPGLSAVVPPKYENAQCFTSLITRPKTDVLDADYLCAFINSPVGKRFILGAEAGGAQKNVNAGTLETLEVYLPPMREQKKIAEILSTWDRAIELLSAVINFEKHFLNGLLGHSLSQKNSASRLGDYFRVLNGNAFKSSDYCEIGVPLIRISNIQDGYVTHEGAALPESYIQSYSKFIIRDGDVLIAMSGATTGKFGIYKSAAKALLNQRVGKFELINDAADKRIVRFVLFFLQEKILEIAAGGAQPNISSSAIEGLPVSLPNRQEQVELCDLFETVESNIKIRSDILEQVKNQKQGLMQKLLTGKVRVKV